MSHYLQLLSTSQFLGSRFCHPWPYMSPWRVIQAPHTPSGVKNGVFARDHLRGSLRLQGSGRESQTNAPEQDNQGLPSILLYQHVRLWQDLRNGRDTGQWLPLPSSPAACSHGGLQQSLQHDGKGQLLGVAGCIPPMVTSDQGFPTPSLAFFFSAALSIVPARSVSLFKSEEEGKKTMK